MIKFNCVYEQRCDMGSSVYDVILDKEYTVEEFVDVILKQRVGEWGYFGIYDDGKTYSGDPKIEYVNGGLREQFPGIFLNEKVVKVKATGSWGAMDHLIHIENPRVGELESKAQKKARATREAWWKLQLEKRK